MLFKATVISVQGYCDLEPRLSRNIERALALTASCQYNFQGYSRKWCKYMFLGKLRKETIQLLQENLGQPKAMLY